MLLLQVIRRSKNSRPERKNIHPDRAAIDAQIDPLDLGPGARGSVCDEQRQEVLFGRMGALRVRRTLAVVDQELPIVCA